MDKSDDNAWVRKRLDAVILLLLEASPAGAATITKKIERLWELGFTQAEIAQVVQKKANYVSAVLGRKSSGTKEGE